MSTASAVAHSGVRELAPRKRVSYWLVLDWAQRHWPELLVVAVGMGLRLMLLRTYDVTSGYDYSEHQAPIEWWQKHFAMPPLLLSRGAYHPQLYYMMGGLLRRLGADWQGVQALSVGFGCFRLLVAFAAAQRYLPHRSARVLALGLAAFMPASVQLDGMMTQEALNNLLSAGFIVALLEFCRTPVDHRFRRALLLGGAVGFGLLVKVSNFALLAVLCLAPLLELIQRRPKTLRDGLATLRGWAVAVGVAVAVCGWQYAYNRLAHGKTVLDGWHERPTQDVKNSGAHLHAVPDRRTLGYLAGFSTDVVRFPYYPSGLQPESRFWSVLIASAFCDYYNYSWAPANEPRAPLTANGRQVGQRATLLARSSVAGGVVIAAWCAAAWLVSVARLLRRREVARLLVLAVPALGVAGQAYFAIVYPFDFEGVVKGVYFQFATLPLCALFGVAVSWSWQSPMLRPLAAVGALSLVPVAAYSTYCAIW